MRFRQNKKTKSRYLIETAPLVNVLLLLLIFFLYSMGVSRLSQGPAAGRIGVPSTNSITVAISLGQVIIDGRQTNELALKNLPRNRDIIITATKDIPYVKVMNILDALRTSGHTRISLATKPMNN